MDSYSVNSLPHYYIAVDTYELIIYTGNPKGSGTDAQIRLEIFGENGSTGIIYAASDRELFEEGSEDKLEIQHVFLGGLKKMNIGGYLSFALIS